MSKPTIDGKIIMEGNGYVYGNKTDCSWLKEDCCIVWITHLFPSIFFSVVVINAGSAGLTLRSSEKSTLGALQRYNI